MAPVIKEMERFHDMLEPVIVVTGQHKQMLAQVLKIFEIEPDYDLAIMESNQTLTSIVIKSMQGLEEIVLREKPDMLLVQGDTSTTFAAGLSAFYHKIPLGHIEAGLRSFDKLRPFPEEINRKLTTTLADLHFPPTRSSLQNLLDEKVPRDKIYLTGNTVIDALLQVAKKDYNLATIGLNLKQGKKQVLVTTHRRENFGEPIKNICSAIAKLAAKYRKEIEFVLPVHHNPQVSNPLNELLGNIENVKLIEPLDYEPFVHLMKAAFIILTDSGGIQEEAPSLGKPVLVMREKTERPEAIESGSVKLVGMNEQVIIDEVSTLLDDPLEYARRTQKINPYGDGQASLRIIRAILHYFGAADHRPEEFDAKVCD